MNINKIIIENRSSLNIEDAIDYCREFIIQKNKRDNYLKQTFLGYLVGHFGNNKNDYVIEVYSKELKESTKYIIYDL